MFRAPYFVATLVLASISGCANSIHVSGDPGGENFRTLQAMRLAIPSNALSLETQSSPASWYQQCADGTGHAGWVSADVLFQFNDYDAQSLVITDVSSALQNNGWHRHDVGSPQGGPIAHWTRVVVGLPLAQAFLYPVPANSNHWFMTGSWQPSPTVDYGDCA